MINVFSAFYISFVRILRCGLLSFVSAIAFSTLAYADSSVQSLLDNQKIAIKAWLDPADDIIATQQVNLNIEVSTHRWFLGGTRIGRLEIDDAIVLRRDSFAVNSSRRQEGENWAVQLWTITLYPQRKGQFNVPSIPVNITVSGEDNQPLTGVLHTEELVFNAQEPQGLDDKKDWLATTLLEVDDQFNKDTGDLKKGDSVQRIIRFKAENVAAMMLPELSFDPIDGVGVYPKPPEIEDTVNRGEYLAERTETVNYVIEQAGEYRLPALTFYWWDLNSQQVQTVELPERILSTLGAKGNDGSVVTGRQSQVDNLRIMLKKAAPFIAMLVLVLLLVVAVVWAIKRHHRKAANIESSRKKCEAQFVQACQQYHYIKAVSLLYQWFDHQALHTDKEVAIGPIRDWLTQLDDSALEAQFNRLMEYACSPIGKGENESQPINPQINFEGLMNRLQQQSKSSHLFFRYAKPIHLRLN